MIRPSLVLIFITLLLGTFFFIDSSRQLLPPIMAVHFNAASQANGFAPRDGYVDFMRVFSTGIPLLVTLLVTFLPRLFPNAINIPYRDYWLAPQRREATLGFLSNHGLRFGCLMLLFLAAIHWQVIQANTRTPPHLDNGAFFGTLMLFGFVLLVWILAMMWRFLRKPD